MIIPKGAKGAYLFGTNNSEFPGYKKVVNVGDVKFGVDDEFMTKIRNRPITFKEQNLLETYEKLSGNERLAVTNIAKKILI